MNCTFDHSGRCTVCGFAIPPQHQRLAAAVRRNCPGPTGQQAATVPSLWGKIMGAAGTLAKHAAGGFRKVSAVEREQRLAICGQCPERVPCAVKIGMDAADCCRQCGCVLDTATKWKAKDCPLGKWPAASVPGTGSAGAAHRSVAAKLPASVPAFDSPAFVVLQLDAGLGDAVQATVVVRHLVAKTKWQIAVQVHASQAEVFCGLCPVIMRGSPLAEEMVPIRLEFREPTWHSGRFAALPRHPLTKAELCLIEQFGITPEPELCAYHAMPMTATEHTQ